MQTTLKTKKLEIKFNHLSKKFSFKNTFKPTYTTFSIINIVAKYSLKKKKILDLGCGSGIITATIYDKRNKSNFFLSDLSKSAVKSACENLKSEKISSIVKVGDCYDPWKGKKFDIIINDVSGVSKKVSSISPWFKNIPADKSENGNFLLKKILNESDQYMNSNSVLVTPIISLSNVADSIFHIKKKYRILDKKKFLWPLPTSMKKHEKLLKKLKLKKNIDYEFKFGTIICYTIVLVLKKK